MMVKSIERNSKVTYVREIVKCVRQLEPKVLRPTNGYQFSHELEPKCIDVAAPDCF